MRAVVLVGGEGTRLRPLTYTTPKQMLTVAEVTMIERVVGHLVAHGVTDVVLSMGYRPDAFLVAFPDDRCAGARLTYAVEPEPMDTAGGIRFAAVAAGLHEQDEPFVVVNGDVLSDLDVTGLVAFHRERGAEATISLTPVEDPSAFGVVPTDAKGRVEAFIEKPPRDEAPTNLINAGTYVLEPSVIGRIPSGRRVSIERETFPALVAAGRLYALASDAYWLDAGTPATYLRAALDLLDRKRPGVPAPGAAQSTPGVWTLGPHDVHGTVEAPVLLGAGAVVAAGADVRRSVIGAGAVVGSGATVVDSVLLHGAVVEDGAHVEGSIVGEGAVVGPAARLTDLTVLQGGVTVAGGAVLAAARIGGGVA